MLCTRISVVSLELSSLRIFDRRIGDRLRGDLTETLGRSTDVAVGEIV
jgi:hypothetical protein